MGRDYVLGKTQKGRDRSAAAVVLEIWKRSQVSSFGVTFVSWTRQFNVDGVCEGNTNSQNIVYGHGLVTASKVHHLNQGGHKQSPAPQLPAPAAGGLQVGLGQEEAAALACLWCCKENQSLFLVYFAPWIWFREVQRGACPEKHRRCHG